MAQLPGIGNRESSPASTAEEQTMGRFKPETVARVDEFAHRMVDVAEEIARAGRSERVVNQVIGCGTSAGANLAEADEAMSRKDFCKALGDVVKELNESLFWLRLLGNRAWIPDSRLADLQSEASQLKKMFGAMISRTRRRTTP